MKKTYTNRSILFLVLLAVGIALTSCGDDPKPHYTVSQETKDYCVFLNDTRWIYEEENIGLLDTLKVYEFQFNKAEWEDRQYTYDIYVYMVRSSILGYGINDFYRFYVFPEWKYGAGENVCTSAGPLTRGLQPIEYFDALDTGTVFIQYANTDGIKYVAYHDSLEIQGRYYTEVKVFEHLTKIVSSMP